MLSALVFGLGYVTALYKLSLLFILFIYYIFWMYVLNTEYSLL